MSGLLDPYGAYRLLTEANDLAYRGDSHGASQIVEDVRKTWSISDDVALAARVFVTEGVIQSCKGEWHVAADRFRRAQLLWPKGDDGDDVCMLSAWRAYVDFNLGDLGSAATCAIHALVNQNAGASSVFRASTVLASLHFYCGSDQLGHLWFEYARKTASGLGNSPQTSALHFNAVAVRVSAERFRRVVLGQQTLDLRVELKSARSLMTFDALAGIHLISPLHCLIQAQILNLLGEKSEARAVLLPWLDRKDGLEPEIWQHLVIELLWSSADLPGAFAELGGVDALVLAAGGLSAADDRAVAFRLAIELSAGVVGKNRRAQLDAAWTAERDKFLAWQAEYGPWLEIEGEPALWRLK